MTSKLPGGTVAAVPGLDPRSYEPSKLHAPDAIWQEKNCYVDIWIEIIHCLGLPPEAAMGFTLAGDFEGDQWTFFKPSHDELRLLYGLDVQELTTWRPLLEQSIDFLAAGKLVSVESDSFWLPNTAATDYRKAHGKTTIVINAIDLAAQRMCYFHSAGYHEMSGEDFVKTFRLDAGNDPEHLPLFAEYIRSDRVVRHSDAELKAISADLLRKYVDRLPIDNPVVRFGDRVQAEIPNLQARGLAYYHKWAFATVRQLGAAMELGASNLRWLAPDQADFISAAEHLERISFNCKSLILKLARAVNSRKTPDLSETCTGMSEDWRHAMELLRAWRARPR